MQQLETILPKMLHLSLRPENQATWPLPSTSLQWTQYGGTVCSALEILGTQFVGLIKPNKTSQSKLLPCKTKVNQVLLIHSHGSQNWSRKKLVPKTHLPSTRAFGSPSRVQLCYTPLGPNKVWRKTGLDLGCGLRILPVTSSFVSPLVFGWFFAMKGQRSWKIFHMLHLSWSHVVFLT